MRVVQTVNTPSPKKHVQIAGKLWVQIYILFSPGLIVLYIFGSLTKSQCSKIVQDMFEKVRDEYVSKADIWKAVPDSAYDEETKQPAIIYGMYHLLRLLGIHFTNNTLDGIKNVYFCKHLFGCVIIELLLSNVYCVNIIDKFAVQCT